MHPQITQIKRRNLWMVNSYWLAVITLLPIAFTSFIWLQVIGGITSRAIDGSGHFAIAQIYDRSIFPETFGWTNAYFAGMPFPNLYPPLFFWLVALLHRVLSFAAAFKLVIGLPLIVMPLVTWAFSYVHTQKNRRVAFGAAIASATLYTLGEIFQPNTGLDMSSTLLDGFYTQPLGYVLLLLWMLIYLLPQQKAWRFVLSALLLALTVLANFFNAITATIFIAAVLAFDLWHWFREVDASERRQLRNTLLLHFASPWLALALTAFWMVPMISSYQYLVTRPLIKPLGQLITPPIWCWYFLAATGAFIWLRRPFGRLAPYLATCFILLVILIFAGSLAPTWFPLQVFRFFSTLNALLCLPIGISIAHAFDLYLGKKTRDHSGQQPIKPLHAALLVVLTIGLLSGLAFAMSSKKLTQAFAFHTDETFKHISNVLEFGKSHRNGRYLVEVLPPRAPHGPVRADSLALNAYLGSQGNEPISIVYREASPNSSFFNAELNAFSAYRENFGISSTLMDDKDFINQPLSQHLKRLEFIGVRYLVIGTTEMKSQLAGESGLIRHEVGPWTIFELSHKEAQESQADASGPFRYARVLPYRPALVVTDFTVKLRRQDQYDFIRLAEEQFNDAWFDVLLVHSPEVKLDLIPDLEKFGALIVERYDFQDESSAFARLKEFAQTRPLILISSDAPLFGRIQSALAEFPRAVVIQRTPETMSDWVEAVEPRNSYESSSIRGVWRSIRAALDKEKIPVTGDVQSQVQKNSVWLEPAEKNVPVMIAQTYNPKWVRNDRGMVYAGTPFFTVTFIDQPTQLVFQRSRFDRAALWVSLCALLAVAGVLVTQVIKRRNPRSSA